MALYQPRHEQQTRAGNSAVTRRSGCTWTSGATGADAASGGAKDRTPDYVKSLVKVNEETNPSTPGWSLPDLDLAMKRLGVPFDVRSGRGWDAVLAAHNAGLYLVLQGDSDQFGNHTCSGAFDGDHAIGIRPGTYQGRWPIDDPICPDMRTETPAVLRAYAQKLWPQVFFGAFTEKVPQLHTGKWSASVQPLGNAKYRQFFTFEVANPHQSPLFITAREAVRTGGFSASCSKPRGARAGPGWDGTPPDSLVLLTSGARKGQYIDGKFAVET
jgi:hypothetical protein